jgi:hypothetical protein
MKAVGPFETSRSDYPLTQRRVPERNTQLRCCGNQNLAQRCGVSGKDSTVCSLQRVAADTHRRVQGSIPSQFPWDLWWTNWHWDGFSSEHLVSPRQYHSIKCPHSSCSCSHQDKRGKAWEPSNETGVLADIGKQEENPTLYVFRYLIQNRFYMIG